MRLYGVPEGSTGFLGVSGIPGGFQKFNWISYGFIGFQKAPRVPGGFRRFKVFRGFQEFMGVPDDFRGLGD